MKALQVVRPATGGMKEQALTLCRGLRDHGWTVEIACPADSAVAEDAAAQGFVVRRIDLVGPLSPVHDARAIRQLTRLVRSDRFDVVHAHGFKAGLVGRVGATLGGCRARLVTVHNHVLYRDDISAFTKWRYRKVERLLARWTEKIIAVSDSIRSELIDAYDIPAGLVTTVHNGVDFAAGSGSQSGSDVREGLGILPDQLLVGTACRFAPQKALDVFVRAAQRVRGLNQDARFVIGGDGPLKPEIEALVLASGLTGVVLFPGLVSDMPSFLSGLDLYVSSSLSEGLPLALVEASAAGLAVVATTAGGTPEVIRDGVSGVLVPPGDDRALSDAILNLLDHPDERRRMAEAGRSIATTEFTTARMIERTIAVYESVVGPASG